MSREGEIFGLLYEKFKAVSFFVYDMKKGKQGGGGKNSKNNKRDCSFIRYLRVLRFQFYLPLYFVETYLYLLFTQLIHLHIGY